MGGVTRGVADETADTNDAARKSYVQMMVGTVVGFMSDGQIVINLAGLPVTMGSVGARPMIGEVVRVAYTAAGDYACLGAAASRAIFGTVTAVGGGSVSVLDYDGILHTGLAYLTSYAPVVGNIVALSWAQGGIVLGMMSHAPSVATPIVPPAPPVVTTGTFDFQAKDSGSYSTQWWTDDVWSNPANKGLWFYGTTIHDTLAGATVTEASIYLPVSQASDGQYLYLNRHGYAVKPAGAPTLTGSQQIDGARTDGWYPLDLGFAQYLIDNTSAGIGTSGVGVRVFTSRAANADSGKLKIVWKK